MAEPVGGKSEGAGLSAGEAYRDGLLPPLRRLDRLLERAVTAAQVAYGPRATADPYRGLYIGQAEVEQLLAREPGVPTLWIEAEGANESVPDPSIDNSPLTWLAHAFGLSSFDVDLILIALAPELDLRYERLYAYLQDDVTRKRPSVDLALNLLCPSAEAKLKRRGHFAVEAPLIRHGLLHLIPDPNQLRPPLLAYYLKLDEQIVHLLLGQEGLDARLASCCQVVQPAVHHNVLPMSAAMKRALLALVRQARTGRHPLRLYFQGPQGIGKRRIAEAIAGEVSTTLLAVDLIRTLAVDTDFEWTFRLLFREAWLGDAILYFDNLDALRGDERFMPYQHLVSALGESTGVTILAGAQPWGATRGGSGGGPIGVISVSFPMPDFAQRQAWWQACLSTEGITLDRPAVEALAGRFRLTPVQIAEAVVAGHNHALWRVAAQAADQLPSRSSVQPTVSDLFTAARAQSGIDLGTLARKIEPMYTWNDIVLPSDALVQLRGIGQRITYRHRVLDDWGFGRKLSLGRGVNALFAGSSGTGKTMAAEIIAHDVGLDLYKIDLSGVVSKYIGETEKNLDRIFTAAESANAILFFDEADALFGKRSEVRDSHDRYANIEISYLLQKLEQYEGVAILATNLRQNMDEAFTRRLQCIIEFPFPDELQRQQIWQVLFPPEAPRDEAIDFAFLAKQFRLSGGHIKNIVLGAAFLAAANGGRIGMEQLIQATWRECQKIGRALSASDFGKYAEVVQ